MTHGADILRAVVKHRLLIRRLIAALEGLESLVCLDNAGHQTTEVSELVGEAREALVSARELLE